MALVLMAVLWQSSNAAWKQPVYGASNQKAWRLFQTAKMQGDCQSIVTDGAIKVGVPKNGSYVVSVAPFKEVTFYSVKTNKVCRVSASYLRNAFERAEESLNGFVMRDMPLLKLSTGTFKGLQTQIYSPPSSFGVEQDAKVKSKIMPRRMPKTAVFQVTQEFNKNSAVWKIAGMFFGTPPANGYPLCFNYKDIDGDPHPFLNTIKMERCSVSDSEFAIPANLETVKTPLEVNAGKSDDEAIMLMLPSAPKHH